MLVHGLLCSRLDMAHFAEELVLRGFTVLAPATWQFSVKGHRRTMKDHLNHHEYWDMTVLEICDMNSDPDLHGMANTLQTLFLKLSKGDGRFCESCYSGRKGVGIKSLHIQLL